MAATKHSSLALFLFSLVAILLTFCDAAPIDQNTTSVTVGGHVVSVHGIVLSVILFISGAYLCFLGGVHQETTMFLVGFFVGANVAYIILTNARSDYGANQDTILLVVCVVVGLLAGCILSCCFFLAVYLLGALLGYLVALWILSWSDNGVIQSNWGRAVLIIVLVIVGIVLMAFLERPMFIIATAFVGSFAIFVGIDMYVQTGFAALVSDMLRARSVDVVIQATSGVRGMLGGCLALAVVGALIQFMKTRKNAPPQWRQRHPYGQYGWRRV